MRKYPKVCCKKSNKHMKKTLIKQIKDKYTHSLPIFDWEMLHTGLHQQMSSLVKITFAI